MTAALAALLIVALVTFVGWALSGPFRARPRERPQQSDERRALESAKEAKYSEIRDNETDYRTGKLSDADFRALDRQLRAEAVEILRAIDAARGPRRGRAPLDFLAMQAVFSTVQVVICVILVLLILMHSGKDSGLSGAFGVGTGTGPLGGGSLVERNLNRWTIFFAILFVANTILLLKHPWGGSG